MEHPQLDYDRSFICASLLWIWGAAFLILSSVPLVFKLIAYACFTVVLSLYVERRRLTYTATCLCILASTVLALADPVYLLQTILATIAVFVLAAVWIFVPTETMCIFMVALLTIVYSALLTIAIGIRTDPAFAGLALLAIATIALATLR